MHPPAFSSGEGGPRGAVNEEDIIAPNTKQKSCLILKLPHQVIRSKARISETVFIKEAQNEYKQKNKTRT